MNFSAKKKLNWVWLVLFMICSCSTFDTNSISKIKTDIPESFSIHSPNEKNSVFYTNKWWHAFNSQELDYLIHTALSNNQSLTQVWERLDQSQYIALQKGATRLPDATLSSGVIDQEATLLQNARVWSSGISSIYELDLWGRLKAIRESAKYDIFAARAAVDTAAMTLSAEVAIRWTRLIACKLETAILVKQLQANQEALELIELRFEKALASALDVLQQKQAVEATTSLLPIAKRKERLANLELATLLGTSEEITISSCQLPALYDLPHLGIPSDLLERRPDVKLAANNFKSKSWLIKAARADRLPSFRISASSDTSASALSTVLDSWSTTLAGNISFPLFDGNRRKAEQERIIALSNEMLAAYKETILKAIEEVERFITLEQTQQEYILALNTQLNASRQSYQEAISRYQNGAIEYTTVLFQLNSYQQLERNMVDAQTNLIGYRIALYRALGGDWMKDLEAGES